MGGGGGGWNRKPGVKKERVRGGKKRTTKDKGDHWEKKAFLGEGAGGSGGRGGPPQGGKQGETWRELFREHGTATRWDRGEAGAPSKKGTLSNGWGSGCGLVAGSRDGGGEFLGPLGKKRPSENCISLCPYTGGGKARQRRRRYQLKSRRMGGASRAEKRD